MPPCVIDNSTTSGKKAATILQLNNLKKAIPDNAFQKSIVKAFSYMLFDYFMWFGSVYVAHTICNSPIWATLSFWQQALFTVVFWNIAGFFMWGIFVIGHDCGHSTFSDSEKLNDFIGHITHGSILVPYYPWQVKFSPLNSHLAVHNELFSYFYPIP